MKKVFDCLVIIQSLTKRQKYKLHLKVLPKAKHLLLGQEMTDVDIFDEYGCCKIAGQPWKPVRLFIHFIGTCHLL